MSIKKLLPATKMLTEAKKSKGHNVILEIIYFVLVFFVSALIESIFMIIPEFIYLFNNEEYINLSMKYAAGEISIDELSSGVLSVVENMPDLTMVIMLFATAIVTASVFVYCRFIEKRRLSTLGFRKSGALKEYLFGMLAGAVIFSAAVGICLLTGALSFEGVCANIPWGILALFLVGYLVQGMSEEVVFRGYFMVSMSRRIPIAAAVLISSVGFACAHLGNSGISVLAFVNLTLFGIFAAVYILKRGNIWGACGIHSLWNFVQGNLYGISVSGMGKTASVMEMSSVEGKELINGGAFGLEGGLAVTIVLVVGIVIVLLTKTKECELAEENDEPVQEVAATV